MKFVNCEIYQYFYFVVYGQRRGTIVTRRNTTKGNIKMRRRSGKKMRRLGGGRA